MMVDAPLYRPETLAAALAVRAEHPVRLLAGGTDFFPAAGARPTRDPVLDITAIAGLRGVSEAAEHWRIGAGVTWSELLTTPLPTGFDALKRAASQIGSVQIQNTATLVGNVCNASPAADGVPPLLALDAVVEVGSLRGTRSVALADFITGVRSIDLRPDELVTAILVPKEAGRGHSGFLKLGSRKYLVISIACVAIRLDINDAGNVRHARIAVGACSPVAQRLTELERTLTGQTASAGNFENAVLASSWAELSPISDIRASADYRRHAARSLVRRGLLSTIAKGRLDV